MSEEVAEDFQSQIDEFDLCTEVGREGRKEGGRETNRQTETETEKQEKRFEKGDCPVHIHIQT